MDDLGGSRCIRWCRTAKSTCMPGHQFFKMAIAMFHPSPPPPLHRLTPLDKELAEPLVALTVAKSSIILLGSPLHGGHFSRDSQICSLRSSWSDPGCCYSPPLFMSQEWCSFWGAHLWNRLKYLPQAQYTGAIRCLSNSGRRWRAPMLHLTGWVPFTRFEFSGWFVPLCSGHRITFGTFEAKLCHVGPQETG